VKSLRLTEVLKALLAFREESEFKAAVRAARAKHLAALKDYTGGNCIIKDLAQRVGVTSAGLDKFNMQAARMHQYTAVKLSEDQVEAHLRAEGQGVARAGDDCTACSF
jgi:hypothetical protein